jgi:hypothetical protein
MGWNCGVSKGVEQHEAALDESLNNMDAPRRAHHLGVVWHCCLYYYKCIHTNGGIMFVAF